MIIGVDADSTGAAAAAGAGAGGDSGDRILPDLSCPDVLFACFGDVAATGELFFLPGDAGFGVIGEEGFTVAAFSAGLLGVGDFEDRGEARTEIASFSVGVSGRPRNDERVPDVAADVATEAEPEATLVLLERCESGADTGAAGSASVSLTVVSDD